MDNRFYFVKFEDARGNDLFFERVHIISMFILKEDNEISVATVLGSIRVPMSQRNIDAVKSLTVTH